MNIKIISNIKDAYMVSMGHKDNRLWMIIGDDSENDDDIFTIEFSEKSTKTIIDFFEVFPPSEFKEKEDLK